jgi:hypothetical protein
LQDSLQQQGEPLSRLSAMLLQLAAFAKAEGGVISQLLLDAGSGEVAAVEFIRNLAPRHPQLLLQCLSEAQQAGQLCQAPPLHQLMFLMSALGFPVLLQQLNSGKHILPDLLQQGLASYALEPVHLQQRLHWALKGLSARERQMTKTGVAGLLVLALLAAGIWHWQQDKQGNELVLSGNVDIREVNLSFRVVAACSKCWWTKAPR